LAFTQLIVTLKILFYVLVLLKIQLRVIG